MNASEYIVDFLVKKGVKTVFAYPGANVIRLYAELCKSAIRVVLSRHEQGSIEAAVGYAKASGEVAVCIATSGPGATNLVTGIADAYLDSVPLLVITGQVAASLVGRDAFQEADIMGITLPVTKHNYLVRSKSELMQSVAEAWEIAKTPRCGPVLVDVTSDIFSEEIAPPPQPIRIHLPRRRENPYPFERSAEKIAESFVYSRRPLILAGGGVVADGAGDAIAELSERFHIPVVQTLMALGLKTSEKFSHLLGLAGIYGGAAANAAMEKCDLLIAVGTRFSDRTIPDFESFSRERVVIHIDADPAELQKNVTADICVAGRAGDVIMQLSKTLPEERKNDICLNWWTDEIPCAASDAELASDNLHQIFEAINSYISGRKNAIIATDIGNCQMSAARIIKSVVPRGFITSGGLGAMGSGLPFAIGAAYSAADFQLCANEIILICGDGGFQMTMHELALIKDAPVKIRVIVVNNFSLEMVKQLPGAQGGEFALRNPDFEKLAEAYSLAYACASTGEQITAALASCADIIEVRHCATEAAAHKEAHKQII